MRVRPLITLLLLAVVLPACVLARADVTLSYTSISIPTRDGKFLAADLYYAGVSPQTKPVILIQTPYNKDRYHGGTIPGPAGGIGFPVDEHYNYVVVDWRGFYGSSDAAVAGYDRGLDGYDCVEWIAGRSWCDGKVGTWGSSALGLIQYQTAVHHPPHLVCINPQVKDFQTLYESCYYGGDYRKEHVESLERLGLISTAVILAHPDEDSLWQSVEAATAMAPDIQVPALVVGGWYDHYPNDVLRSFADLRSISSPSVRSRHKLIVGPWTHTGVNKSEQGVLVYPDADKLYDQEIQFWDFYLRGMPNGWDQRPAVSYYQMGENVWQSADLWDSIPRRSVTLYLQPSGGLDENPPPEGPSFDAILFDPDAPTPSLGGARNNPFDPTVLFGPQDLSSAIETRPDVLVFSTPVLTSDLKVNGAVSVKLFVSSDRTDTDFCVRLTDVYPDGRSLVVTQGIRRMRFRNSYASEDLMTPGQVYPVTVNLQDIALTFLQGHRLRIDVCCADYPMFDVNRNDGGPMYTPGPSYVAENDVYHDAARPSSVFLQTTSDAQHLYYPDDAPFTLSFAAGGDSKWRVDCSTDSTFAAVDVSSKTSKRKWLSTDSWTPGQKKWSKVLALGTALPGQDTKVYWRSEGKTSGETDSGSFLISKAAAAVPVSPPDGGSVSDSDPVAFTWDLNHNSKVQVEFSSSADFSTGVEVSSKSNKPGKKWIKGSAWTPGSGKWEKITALGSVVFWRVHAGDSIGRETFSRAFSLNIGNSLGTGLFTETINVDGVARRYACYIPENLGGGPRPLVLELHGGGVYIEDMTGESGYKTPYKLWMNLADAEKFIVVYPEGLNGSYGSPTWNDCRANSTVSSNADDVGFISALIDEISSSHNIDPNRIYASGTSNGGLMALRLAVELPDRIAAVAAVAAAMPDQSECAPPVTPVSVLFMNGTADNHLPYEGGIIGNPPSPDHGSVFSTDESVDIWRTLDQTESAPVVHSFPDIDPADDSTVASYTYSNGVDGTEVVLYKITGGGHSAPSIKEQYSWLFELAFGKQNHDIEMVHEVWNFFEANRRRADLH